MSDPLFDVQQEHVFTVRMDIAGLAALEKGMAFYSERAILQDGDPARDLSRTLTSMLMKLAVSRNAVVAPKTATLPPSKEEAQETADPVADVEAELRRRLAEHEIAVAKMEVSSGEAEADAMTEEKIQEAVKQVTEELGEAFVTDEDTEAAIGNLGTEDMDDDDPLTQQLDAMIGD